MAGQLALGFARRRCCTRRPASPAATGLNSTSTLDTGAQALLTTPGAGKWYRSAGPLAEQSWR
jgi:hypothetical protein